MHKGFFAYNLLRKDSSKIIILKDNTEIDELFFAINFFKDYFKRDFLVERFYSYEIPPVSSIPPSTLITSNRIKSIYSLINNSDKNIILLTNINAVLQPVMSEEDFFEQFESLSINQEYDIDSLAKRLISLRYTKKDFIEDVGDFAKRGFIFDIFSPLYDKPLRIEFFGNEIESIKLFYLANQRTYKQIDSAEILPAFEYEVSEDNYGYINLVKDNTHFLMDYENIKSFSMFRNFDEDFLNSILNSAEFYKQSYGSGVFLDENRVKHIFESSKYSEDINYSEQLFVDNLSLDEKIDRIKRASKSKKVIIACASNIRRERVERFLKEKGLEFAVDEANKKRSGIYLSNNYLKNGFIDKENALVFVSFEDIFQKVIQRKQNIKSKKFKTFIQNSKVVHKNYGVGIYRGIKKLDIDEDKQDFVEIEYANNDKLYVPVYGVDSIFEYHGDSSLDTLGSNRWKNAQDNIKKSIKKILTELVNTYAQRELTKRAPFVVDSIEYREFETLFEYEETKDQARAIEDIKADMSSEKPMDRLVCGDVSFGKTEVAMRACAISVFNEKQAVFMAPTTILSIQHYNTLKERFAQFPVNIALLNRFSTKKQRNEILENLKKGLIDILVSTHSVYSDKIEFANLGLVVIDEEQRFGVKVKEHLKSRYPRVDMLYLSATPIPRTLNMALNGIFDISVIKTPPLERKPIETFVLRRKKSVIRDAILKELSRGGNIYFVHNNIETIENLKEELDGIVPFAKKAIVHAKMPKKAIKSRLEEFNSGRFDILIATSIIESGLDIKNVNTIIVDMADRFGLADLYQLRGRVGRGDRVAYAYLLRGNNISDDAKKRLYYMKEFVERGVGFNLALKDMEIRGQGNILGKDQAGKIKSVGFETYASLIEEAISDLKNQPIERDVEIKSSFSAYIDDEFADEDDKFAIYKMIYASKDLNELESIENELHDTFGQIPVEVKNLLIIASIKILAKKVYVKSLSLSKKGVLIEFYIDAKINTDQLIKAVGSYKGKFVSDRSVFFDKLGGSLDEIYDNIRNILQLIV